MDLWLFLNELLSILKISILIWNVLVDKNPHK